MPTDVPAPASQGLPNDGVMFGHFLVRRRDDGGLWELGRGAMGVTYRAFDTSLKVEVALKVIGTGHVQSENARRRFQREARAAAKIRHPNVASVLYLGEQNGEFFYAMEFIEGRSLESLLKEDSAPIPLPVAIALAAQAAAALNAAHRNEVVHRDLKPSNLMIVEDDAAFHEDDRTIAAGGKLLKIIDFGLARRFGGGRDEESLVTQTYGGFVGTPAYASPEQCAGAEDIDGRSDLYSLGVILWQMLTGQRPFIGRVVEVLGKQQFQAPPVEQLANLPQPVAQLVMGLLIKEPNSRRPQTARELRSNLDRCLHALVAHPAGGLDSSFALSLESSSASSEKSGDTTTTPGIGSTLASRYRLGREAGAGHGGRLFLAADLANPNRFVALKLLPPERLADPGLIPGLEAALAVALRHPNPGILSHGPLERSGALVFYVREWADGFSLEDLLRARGSLRAPEAFRLLEGLPGVLDFASAAGFPWLEVSPRKVFVVSCADGSSSGSTDWPGLRAAAVEVWPAFQLKLNPLRFPPSALATDATSAGVRPADGGGPVAGLARIVHELLGGLPGGVAPLTALNAEANSVLRRAIAGEGFRTATDFMRALRLAAGDPVRTSPPIGVPGAISNQKMPDSGGPPPRRWKVTVIALAATALTLLTGIVLWLSGVLPIGSHPAQQSGEAASPTADPTPASPFASELNAARTAFQRQDYQAALAAYQRADALQPGSPEVAKGREEITNVAKDLSSKGDALRTSDPAKAVEAYRAAADLGNANAQFNLGRMYRNGRGGLPEDEAQAVVWYRKAAEQGDFHGQYQLGVMYATGRGGLPKDDTQAVSWYTKSAEQGFALAQNTLGAMYATGRGGLPKDETQAVVWYRKAAEQGYGEAQYNLGTLFETGRGGLPKDDAQAVIWYRKAAVQGHSAAQAALTKRGLTW